jgi:hypothetical protein
VICLRSFGSSTRTALFFFLRRNFAYQMLVPKMSSSACASRIAPFALGCVSDARVAPVRTYLPWRRSNWRCSPCSRIRSISVNAGSAWRMRLFDAFEVLGGFLGAERLDLERQAARHQGVQHRRPERDGGVVGVLAEERALDHDRRLEGDQRPRTVVVTLVEALVQLPEDGQDGEVDQLGDLGGGRPRVLGERADLAAARGDGSRLLEQRDVLDARAHRVDRGLVFEKEKEAHGRRVMVGRWAMSTMTRPTSSPKSG